MSRVVIAAPRSDFDPTEAGVSWRILSASGVEIQFATPDGNSPAADQRMVTGEGLWPWSWILKADANGLKAYQEMLASEEFRTPLPWQDIRTAEFDAIVLPGGHAPGMKAYLESDILQRVVADFVSASKLVGAICHGVVLLGRSKAANGRSVLAGRRATALLRSLELTAWALTCLRLGNYYRTYPETVQAEVTRQLEDPHRFISGPTPLKRDSLADLDAGFVVEDGNLITARWPGDAHRFATTLARRLQDTPRANVQAGAS